MRVVSRKGSKTSSGKRHVDPAHGARRTAHAVFARAAHHARRISGRSIRLLRTLHTEHFRIHFHPAYRGKAIEAANEAERAYRLLSTELHPPRGIVEIGRAHV